MKFKYSYKSIGGGVKFEAGRPVLWIKIDTPTIGPIDWPCLVDSGSDDCILDADIGEAMGLDIKSVKPNNATGVKSGANMVGYVHRITYKVNGISCEADVTFTYELATDFGILGRDGFFNHFLVKFDERKGEFELTPYV